MWLTFYIFVFEMYSVSECCDIKEEFSGQIRFRNTGLNQVRQIVQFVGYLDSLLWVIGSESWGRGECKEYSSEFISCQTLFSQIILLGTGVPEYTDLRNTILCQNDGFEGQFQVRTGDVFMVTSQLFCFI